ncbi:MAG: DNA topoisomerase [Eubacteriales bacterium]|nr:DNA topoisomerase [Eubacteriales bacterium]
MILIIAEKPSLGRNIAAAIGENMKKRDGYLECDGYYVSWAFGHLFSLCDVEHYSGVPSGEKRRWTMDGLPCIPDSFDFELKKANGTDKPDAGVQKQFRTICRLAASPEVEAIVNAGDADREGEIIVRLCIRYAAQSEPAIAQKPVYRLWLPDQTPQTVRAQLADMSPDSKYDSLASEGFARTYVDWLYGVNLTRYATLRTGKLLRVGRVIVPIVKAIYDRDMAIRNFVPGKYLAPVSREQTGGQDIELVSKRQFEPEREADARRLCESYNAAGAVVTAVKRKKDTLAPGKLYSLTKLQNYLGKKYKMPMETSLKLAQKLYEEGYLTYPRTNSEYLATAEKDKMKKIIAGCAALGYPVEFKDSKNIFDDSKIESHSALTPTYKIPKKEKLSEDEYRVYSAVMRRFVAVFCAKPCIVSRTQINVLVDASEPEEFVLKGTTILEPGWTAYDDSSLKDKLLPELKKGDIVNIDFKPVEKQTSAPRHYTIETLNNYLKNPFKEDKARAAEAVAAEEGGTVSDEDDYRAIFEGLELGTEATRTGIIDNAKKSRYIDLKKDTYYILPDGEYLIESLTRLNISMDKYKTSTLGRALKRVYRADMTVEQCVGLAGKEIHEIFAAAAPGGDNDVGFFGDCVGNCPLCGKPVEQRGRFYGCSGWREGCKFSVNTYICSRAISTDAMRRLLREGTTGVIDGFVSRKSGKTFSAALVLRDGRAVFDFPSDYGAVPVSDSARGIPATQSTPAEQLSSVAPPGTDLPDYGSCPLCGKPLVRGRTAYGCSGWREGCSYRKPFEQ